MTVLIPEKNASDIIFEELMEKCTSEIGVGTSRTAYEIPDHPDKVIKVSNLESNYSNWVEVITYNFCKDDGKFAPIISWSWSGKYIVMERLTPLEIGESYEFEWPDCLTDRKPSNLGRNKEGVVQALDYALLKSPDSYGSPFS